MKRVAEEEQWHGAGEGPACGQCGSAEEVRWPDRRRRVYCIGCWKGYGSEAAEALLVARAEAQLGRGAGRESRFFPAPPAPGEPRHGEPPLREVTPEDSLDAARRLLQERGSGSEALPPIVLNMANATWIGGGFLTGAAGQEEELCRRSNLFPQLTEALRAGSFPLPELGCIVSPDVLVLRGRTGEGYERLAEPYSVAVITAAAPCGPNVSDEQALAAYVEQMTAKVDALLAVIEHLGYEDLVLSAWGCGAFRNPPKEVARIFREALDGKFRTSFRRVTFAVFDRPDWRESNCSIFKRELAP